MPILVLSLLRLIAFAVIFVITAIAAAAEPVRTAKQPVRTAKQIDALIADAVFDEDTKLAPRVSDATFARRAWLDIVGTIPTPDELSKFLADDHPRKRNRLVGRLLSNESYGQNWARYWRDVVFHRRLEDRSLLAAGPMVEELSEWLNRGDGWDEIATRLITATGDVREEGATALIMAQDGRTEEIAAEVSRVFLGIQLQCAQCHDHPWDDWKREQFHELAAFFPRVGVRPVRDADMRSFKVVVNDRRERRIANPPKNNRRGAPEHYMPDLEDPEAVGTRTQPKFFLTGATLDYGTADADRRGQLADWLTDSEWFATAVTNRMWSELVGEGFYEPVDDLGPEREATAEEACARLASAFAENDYDLKWLVRTIMATDAYQRESRPRREFGATPMTANVAQPLRGDQLLDAMLTVLEVDLERAARLVPKMGGRRGYGSPRAVFNAVFGYDPSEPRELISASIPQALAMMNTPRINQAVRASRRTMLGRLLEETRDESEIIRQLYVRTLSREPTNDEARNAQAYFDEVGGRYAAAEDLLWALLNSAEFRHRR